MKPGWFSEADAKEKVRAAVAADQGTAFYWKYVRVAGLSEGFPSYRFADATSMSCPGHKTALEEGERAEGAAFVKVQTIDGVAARVESWSVTLKIGPAADDAVRLPRLLGEEWRGA